MRYKTGLGEAYASTIFKTTKTQQLPLSRYITALPDLAFFIVSFDHTSDNNQQLI